MCLNMNLLEKISPINDTIKYKYYWSEDKISEDFDCMMRGFNNGYIGRYVTSAGIFLEGITFNYITEYLKISKFALGAAELTFNSFDKWIFQGPISTELIKFICCPYIEFYNKLYTISYIINFAAISHVHLALFYNILFFDSIRISLPSFIWPINLMWENICIWGIIICGLNTIFAKKVQFNTWNFIKQQFREIIFTFSI